jgi:hypothetical protein
MHLWKPFPACRSYNAGIEQCSEEIAMNKLFAAFNEHPASVGEGYFSHMTMAIGFGVRMLYCGFACLIHAVLPFLFVKTGSATIARLHDTMVINRHRDASHEITGSSQSSH